MVLAYVPGCLSPQSPPLPSDTGAVVSGPGWPLPQLPLLRAVPKDSHSPRHSFGCYDIQIPCCPLHIHFSHSAAYKRAVVVTVLWVRTQKEKVAFSRSVCFQKGFSPLLGLICSASIYLLLRPLDEVIPSTPLMPFPESLVFLIETRLT